MSRLGPIHRETKRRVQALPAWDYDYDHDFDDDDELRARTENAGTSL